MFFLIVLFRFTLNSLKKVRSFLGILNFLFRSFALNVLKISQICSELQVEGLRGDLVVTRAAKALAAFEQRTEVTVDDIRKTVVLCLRHRCRRDPMESINSGDKVETVFNEVFSASEI